MFLTAHKIHNGYGWLPEGTVIEVTDNGVIASITNASHPGVVFYEGILMPGFVNAHCHLELSHMKGLVPEHTGLIPFLETIPKHRNNFTDEQKKTARHEAYHELLRNGITTIGDIANTTDTLDVRALAGMHVHTFVESIGFNEANAERCLGFAVQTYNAFSGQKAAVRFSQSIVPHAPYSVSSSLFSLINEYDEQSLLSIHNQESGDEDMYFQSKQGGVQHLLHSLGIDDSLFVPTGKSSLLSYSERISNEHPFIFVHNTCSTRADVQFALNRFKKAYWCLCPNANLYIENKLPDIDMLINEGCVICIGTDSLASNNQLCILSELYSIKEHYPSIDWATLLSWATINGAVALQMQHSTGSIEVGKIPGIVQVLGLNDPNPSIRRIC